MLPLWFKKKRQKIVTIESIPDEVYDMIVDSFLGRNMNYFCHLTNAGLFCPIDIKALIITTYNDYLKDNRL